VTKTFFVRVETWLHLCADIQKHEQISQCTYNVTLRQVRATTVAVKEQ